MSGRRDFLRTSLGIALGVAASFSLHAAEPWRVGKTSRKATMRLFLCGDVMLGRGIDQILQHPSDPLLYEPYVKSALGYVKLAEHVNGELPRKVAPAYVWGDALVELERRQVDLRIINLETSITTSDEPWPKGINYRMHPDNADAITAARIDCCVLSNNHVLDWDHAGLTQTLNSLARVHVQSAGAGADLASAAAPAILRLAAGGRVLVFAAATGDSGVPWSWAAEAKRPGVHRLPDLSDRTIAVIAENVRRWARPSDRVIFSVHWGDNWGYEVSPEQRTFAHALIDEAGVDIVHGHSSHHVRPLEVHRGRLILYGAGDFLNDYEGIRGHEEFHDELGLMYFPTLSERGALLDLTMTPTRIARFRIQWAHESERRWLSDTINRIAAPYGSAIETKSDGAFSLRWQES